MAPICWTSSPSSSSSPSSPPSSSTATSPHPSRHRPPLPLLLLLCARLSPSTAASPFDPVTSCAGRTCRPGEGTPRATHASNPFVPPASPRNPLKHSPHSPYASSPEYPYAPLVAAATRAARRHAATHAHLLVLLCAADFDYRHLAANWHAALARAGLDNGLVYALDTPAFDALSRRGVPAVDGAANVAAWNRTRLGRHVQRAEAERHVAAAAVAAAGMDVLLTEATHVVGREVAPWLRELARAEGEQAVDMAVGKASCDGKPPIGCGIWFNLVFLHGAGTAEQRSNAVAFQLAGVNKGLVDFYLRWYNGAHCITNGFAKEYADRVQTDSQASAL